MFSSRIANSRTRVKLYSQKATLMSRSHMFDGPISGLPAAKCVCGFIFIQASPLILSFKAIHDLQIISQSFSYSDCPLSNPCSAIWIYQATNKLGGSRSPLCLPSRCPSCTRSLARSRMPKAYASVHCSAAGVITPSFMDTNLLVVALWKVNRLKKSWCHSGSGEHSTEAVVCSADSCDFAHVLKWCLTINEMSVYLGILLLLLYLPRHSFNNEFHNVGLLFANLKDLVVRNYLVFLRPSEVASQVLLYVYPFFILLHAQTEVRDCTHSHYICINRFRMGLRMDFVGWVCSAKDSSSWRSCAARKATCLKWKEYVTNMHLVMEESRAGAWANSSGWYVPTGILGLRDSHSVGNLA